MTTAAWKRDIGMMIALLSAMAVTFLGGPIETRAQSQASAPAQSKDQAHAKESAKPPQSHPFILVGAGDISSCKNPEGARATAKLIEQIPGTVFAAGDLAYESGSPDEFEFCYGPTWGRFKERTKPAMGNHEYVNPAAHGYFDYWGAQAGPRGKGYYSFEMGAWHIVVLNTNCYVKNLGGCGAGSPQEAWLKEDLAKHANACIIAYGHHALFSSGIFKKHAVHPELKQLWQDLYAAHADLVLAGHEHSYERFAPQDPDGKADTQHGIREIVVGTGGRSHDLLGFATQNSEVRDWDTYGVLKLMLDSGKYSWEFIPEEGRSFRDSGGGVCHNVPSASN
jgi:acid phosphatase type 7